MRSSLPRYMKGEDGRTRTSLSPAGGQGERDRAGSFPWGRFLGQGSGSGRFLHRHWRGQRSQDGAAINHNRTWARMQTRSGTAAPAPPPARLPRPGGGGFQDSSFCGRRRCRGAAPAPAAAGGAAQAAPWLPPPRPPLQSSCGLIGPLISVGSCQGRVARFSLAGGGVRPFQRAPAAARCLQLGLRTPPEQRVALHPRGPLIERCPLVLTANDAFNPPSSCNFIFFFFLNPVAHCLAELGCASPSTRSLGFFTIFCKFPT